MLLHLNISNILDDRVRGNLLSCVCCPVSIQKEAGEGLFVSGFVYIVFTFKTYVALDDKISKNPLFQEAVGLVINSRTNFRVLP